jgi:hypothetical protein
MDNLFHDATSYDKSLCAWGPLLISSTDVNVNDMFKGTSCAVTFANPSLSDNPLGPFCDYCPVSNSTFPVRETVNNLVGAPIPLPIVPAAVAQRPDGVIVAWAGYDMLVYENPRGLPDGTYTCKFNPETLGVSVRRVESKSKWSNLATILFFFFSSRAAPALPHDSSSFEDTVRCEPDHHMEMLDESIS